MQQLTTYGQRRVFGDTALPDAKRILSRLFVTSIANIEVADDKTDQRRATDLLVTPGFGTTVNVAFRCRSSRFAQTYPDDITIRLSTNGGLSELQKIERGYAHYMLYGFVEGERLTAWKLIDLAALLHALSVNPSAAKSYNLPDQEPFLVVNLSKLSADARSSTIVASDIEG